MSIASCGSLAPGPVTPTSTDRGEQAVTQANQRIQTSTEPLAHATDYVVAAGLRWLVELNMEPLLANVASLAPELLPKNNVQSFERSIGIELSTVREVTIAGFDYATLYVARGTAHFNEALSQFSARQAVDPIASDVGNGKLYTGLFDNEVVHYATLDATTALWSNGDPTSAKAALLLAQRQLRRSPSALDGASLRLLPQSCKAGTAVVFVPGPIASPADASPNSSLVLDTTLALSLQATIEAEVLVLKVCWHGDWKDDGIERTSALLAQLLNSRFATLLELSAAERTGTFTQHGELVEVSYRWTAAKVLKRLQAVLSLDLSALLAPPLESSSSTPASK